jgi:hypothetical protein
MHLRQTAWSAGGRKPLILTARAVTWAVKVRNNCNMSQQHPYEELDHYLTAQVVGPARTLTLGPSASLRQVSDRPARLDLLMDRLTLARGVVASLWRQDAAQALSGWPLPLSALPRWRRRAIGALLLLWSLLLAAGAAALTYWSMR